MKLSELKQIIKEELQKVLLEKRFAGKKELDKDGNEVTTIQSDYILLEKFPKYTNQTQIYMRADDILTICDPSHSVVEYYKKTVG